MISVDEDLNYQELINNFAEQTLHVMLQDFDPTGTMDAIGSIALKHGMPATEVPFYLLELSQYLKESRKGGKQDE